MPKYSQSERRAARSVISPIGSGVAKLIGADDAIQATLDEAQHSGLPGAGGGAQDAYRHILIAAELIRQFGPNLGSKFAQAHEAGNRLDGQSGVDSKMDDHNNALAVDIGKRAKTWDDVVRMARDKIEEAARHGGDGKDGRAVWHSKPQQPNWKPAWPKRPAAPNAKGGEQHRYYNNPNASPDPEDGGPGREPATPGTPGTGPRSEAPDGGTVAGGARRIGREVLKDAAGIGVRPAVAKLQDALNSTIDIGRPLFRDGAFGPKTGERLRQAVARQGTGSVLDTFRRTFPPERV